MPLAPRRLPHPSMKAYDVFELASQATWPESAPLSLAEFMALVKREGEARYRDLPWRNLDDAYAVLVSEVMLQQTQVKRVLAHWERFMGAFPTIDALAAASSADVLDRWQGLGYNRRALGLWRCARECSAHNAGRLPDTAGALIALPGIGQATAAGVVAFASNRPSVYVETNVRTVFLHQVLVDRDAVADRELAPLVAATCLAAESPRAWYYALLDYGAYVKSQVKNPSRRSAHYARQSAFEGSRRQKRAELVRIVLADPGIDASCARALLCAEEASCGRDPVDEELFESLVADLAREGFFRREEDRLVP